MKVRIRHLAKPDSLLTSSYNIAPRPPLAPSTGAGSADLSSFGQLNASELAFISTWLVSYRRTGSVSLAAGTALHSCEEEPMSANRAPGVGGEYTQANEKEEEEELGEDQWEDIDELKGMGRKRAPKYQ
ncbi:hypothetical protein N7541_005178 [Penicillium brevicompactum]|uniref:Uncharacterized protein n=1 Tax=Penicillium brevicompactum TaxID=5074 RepID=A0A9W9REF8_PENBR|nr:hypothetical protein N7541_005178 [Penicillium brevicompactum]